MPINPSAGWSVGQACVNGHKIAGSIDRFPDRAEDFCSTCGARTIAACEACGDPIRGYRSRLSTMGWDLGRFCPKCGQPYPWTAAGIEAAEELAAVMDGLTPDEREMLARSLDDIVRDTPRTPVAAARVKSLLAKAGKAGAAGLRDVLVGVATEEAKRQIGL